MRGRTLRIRQIERYPNTHESDSLTFADGINIILGEPNTGKSKWLAMIDFLLGDTDSATKTLGPLAKKYDGARMSFVIGDTEHTVERHWKQHGSLDKVILDDRKVDADYFSDFILAELDIPQLRFPQGADSTARWRPISWRILMRHLFRGERQWDDIIPKQYPSELHACLMTFAGVGHSLFPDERGELADKINQRAKLEAKREQFEETLQDITREIVAAKEMGVAVTDQSIELAMDRLRSEIDQLQVRKEQVLIAVLNDDDAAHVSADLVLAQDWARYKDDRETLFEDLHRVQNRISDLSGYATALEAESSKLKRAFAAGNILSELKVTHCPLCDQSIPDIREEQDCRLCKQHYNRHSDTGSVRVDLELQQVTQDFSETTQLISQLRVEERANLVALREVEDKLSGLETRLRPLRKATTAIQIPEIAIIDQEIGAIAEKIRQWERIRTVLARQYDIAAEVDSLNRDIRELEKEILAHESDMDLVHKAVSFAEGMNSYLNKIHESSSKRWSAANRVHAIFREKSLDFKINGSPWSTALGGTWTGYFLLAYHYAMMNSTASWLYPGFLILDYPKSFEDVEKTSANVNHTLEPFIGLLQQKDLLDTQIIAAGKGFSDFKGANMIRLEHQWVAPDQQSSQSEDMPAEEPYDYKTYPEDIEDGDNPNMGWL